MKTVLKTGRWIVAFLAVAFWALPTVYEYCSDLGPQETCQELWEFDPPPREHPHPLRHLEFLAALVLFPYLVWCWCDTPAQASKDEAGSAA